ncbi:MAG: hypothetical protein NDJ24_10675 [Alphaproteobacteria bacterium]|nr:hypothetical protein [Alphaproteobacteria bacterium]
MPTLISEDKDLLPILDRLEAGVPQHLSVSDRCKLIQRISASALTRASKQKLTIDSFTREDQALAGLLASIPYSGRWIEFCHDRASHLAETMHGEMPALALQRDWPEWNAARRMDFLQAIARHQIRLFTHDGLSFTLPKIVIDNTPPSIRGSFNAGAWALSTRVNDRVVNVSRQHFDENPPLSLAQTIWHEHIHSLCQQFAAACDSKAMSPFNPFVQDAEIMRQRRLYRAYAGSFFEAAYIADPEENIAFSTQNAFADSWTDRASLTSKLAHRAVKFWQNFRA